MDSYPPHPHFQQVGDWLLVSSLRIMLSIEECRELIPDGASFTDKQIEEIRETLIGLAELGIEDYLLKKSQGKYEKPLPGYRWSSPDKTGETC